MMTFVINSFFESNIREQFTISGEKQYNTRRVQPEVVVNVSIYCPALLSLSLGHHFDNLALKSPTKMEHVGC